MFAYDGARLIVSAIRAVDGHVERQDDFRKALMAAKFDSVRGKFSFNTNHFPIQSVYLLEVKRTAQGALLNDVTEKIAADYPDAYVGQCKMK
jgi:branched-chain amino acid transport system substrate-binding protein